jgi:acetylornithine deacetylase/succinyl-diaminopimelate desuccinylase-like protein
MKIRASFVIGILSLGLLPPVHSEDCVLVSNAYSARVSKVDTGSNSVISNLKVADSVGVSVPNISTILYDSVRHCAYVADHLAAASTYYNALMRTTCVATLLRGGHAENALSQTAVATVNCRLLPDDSPDNVTATLRSVVADSQITVTCLDTSFQVAPLSPLREDVMKVVEDLTASLWPGVVVTPVMSTGATDGLFLRRAGMPVYGVSGMFCDVDDVRAHGKDERIGVKEFYDGVEFMYRFVKAISR